MKVCANYCRLTIGTVMGLVLAAVGCATVEAPLAGHKVDQGLIKGARFSLAVPQIWQGDVLILAPGTQPSGSSGHPKGSLTADRVAGFDRSSPLLAALLSDGWLVATTNYGRDEQTTVAAGVVVQRLVAAIVHKYGPCRQILVEGSSLGANAGLALCEAADPGDTGPTRVSGVIALGAVLAAAGESALESWTMVPHLPVLFVSNRDEIEPVRRYADRVRQDRERPAVWQLDRPGHVNINSAERLAAIRAMAIWAAGGPRPAGSGAAPFDATVDYSDRQSRATVVRGGLQGRITAVDPVYGNIDTDLVAADLAALDLVPGQMLQVVCGEFSRKAWTGHSYADVAAGEMVVFLNADGFLRVAVNQGNAARKLHGHAGEKVEIRVEIARATGRH